MSEFDEVSQHIDRFTPDERTDRPNLGAIHGTGGTLLVESGASSEHLRAFVSELDRRTRPPVVAIVLTHWHWDHSFGSAALDVPVIAHVETARELAIQASYDWSDEALADRVRDGLEIAFCAEMIRRELPDRSDLRIVVPTETFVDRWSIELGGIEAVVEHVGGDHASDSCVVHVPVDSVLFLGDCLYQCLHAPEPYLTIEGVRALVARIRTLDADLTIEGHADDVDDRIAHTARLDELLQAADLVERLGVGARRESAGDDDLAELVEHLLVGQAVG